MAEDLEQIVHYFFFRGRCSRLRWRCRLFSCSGWMAVYRFYRGFCYGRSSGAVVAGCRSRAISALFGVSLVIALTALACARSGRGCLFGFRSSCVFRIAGGGIRGCRRSGLLASRNCLSGDDSVTAGGENFDSSRSGCRCIVLDIDLFFFRHSGENTDDQAGDQQGDDDECAE